MRPSLSFPRRPAAGLLLALTLGMLPVAARAAAPAPAGRHDHVRPAPGTATAAATTASIPLTYGGGRVETTPRAYISYWGAEWQTGFSTGGYTSAQAQTYFSSFIAGSGGSAWQGTTTEYCQGVATGAAGCAGGTMIGNPASGLAGTWGDTTAVPASPTASDILAAAQRLAAHFGGTSSSAVYFVLTPSGKSESGFGRSWCAWHGSYGALAYAYVPYMPDAGHACGLNAVNATSDSSGHGYFDGFSIVGGHEYLEALTDPYPSSGWTDANGAENADKCEWSSTWPASNQAIGGQHFAVQPMWSNAAGACVFAAPAGVSPPPPSSPGAYTPLPPARVLDTRYGIGGSRLGPGGVISVAVAGRGGVPSSGVTAVVLNVTETNATASSYLTVFPSGTGVPRSSTLNFEPATPAANLAEVRVGSDGNVNIFNSAGSVDAIFDVEGYVSSSSPAGSGLYQPLPSPTRVYDSRLAGGAMGPAEVRTVPVAGVSGVPASGAGAVVVNVTSVGGTAPSYFAVTPNGATDVSTVNFTAGDVRPNRAVVRLGADGAIRVYNSAGSADVVLDVAGWFTDGSTAGATGSQFTSIAPVRLVDTRPGTQVGPVGSQLGPRRSLRVQVSGVAGVPSTATTVVLNVTATNPSNWSYLTAYPGGAVPVASDLNYRVAQTVPNLVVVRLAGDGSVELVNDVGYTDLVADVEGWYS